METEQAAKPTQMLTLISELWLVHRNFNQCTDMYFINIKKFQRFISGMPQNFAMFAIWEGTITITSHEIISA